MGFPELSGEHAGEKANCTWRAWSERIKICGIVIEVGGLGGLITILLIPYKIRAII